MGKSKKSEVAAVVPVTKSAKKGGKRDAEKVIEKKLSVKKQKTEQKPTNAAKSSSDEEASEDESFYEDSDEDEPAKTPKKKVKERTIKDTDEEMVDSEIPKTDKKTPKTPAAATPQVQSTGSKTLLAENLSYSVLRPDFEIFFKEAGEVVDVRFGSYADCIFNGLCEVEFATPEVALHALKLNGLDLLGKPVKLDFLGLSSKESNPKGGGGQGQTICIRGFNSSVDSDQLQSNLEEHFSTCGEIQRVFIIPNDSETGTPYGMAYIEFRDGQSLSKALELHGSEFGDLLLEVEKVSPSVRGRGRGRGGGGGFGGGGRSGGRSGVGRSGGGRFGGGRVGVRGSTP